MDLFYIVSGTDLKHSFNFLHDAQGRLQEIVRKKFDDAVSVSNNSAVERCLLPPFLIHCISYHLVPYSRSVHLLYANLGLDTAWIQCV